MIYTTLADEKDTQVSDMLVLCILLFQSPVTRALLMRQVRHLIYQLCHTTSSCTQYSVSGQINRRRRVWISEINRYPVWQTPAPKNWLLPKIHFPLPGAGSWVICQYFDENSICYSTTRLGWFINMAVSRRRGDLAGSCVGLYKHRTKKLWCYKNGQFVVFGK